MKERHFAEVTRFEDPDEGSKLRGAIFFKSETIGGDVEYPIPAEPCFIFAGPRRGFFVVPEPGDVVEIEIDTDVGTPNPVWLCMVYSEEDELPREFITNYGKRMGFVSKSGHLLIMDDIDGAERMFFEHKFGSKLDFLANGNISLKAREITKRDEEDETADVEAAEFQEILLDFENKLIKIHDHHGNIINVNSQGIKLTEKDGGILNLSGGKVALGSTDELLDLFDQTLDEIIKTEDGIVALTVPTAVGPSGPPINSATFTAIKSALDTIKSNLAAIKGSL